MSEQPIPLCFYHSDGRTGSPALPFKNSYAFNDYLPFSVISRGSRAKLFHIFLIGFYFFAVLINPRISLDGAARREKTIRMRAKPATQ
jgi:hypothetical protein